MKLRFIECHTELLLYGTAGNVKRHTYNANALRHYTMTAIGVHMIFSQDVQNRLSVWSILDNN